MKRIIRIILASILFLIAIILCLLKLTGKTGKVISSVISYESASSYLVGEGTVDATKVKNLDIDWVSGDVSLILSDSTNKISFRENAKEKIPEDERMRWYLDGDTLKIKWCRSGLKKNSVSSKTLKVTIPSSLVFEKVTINTVSAELENKGLKTEKLILNTVSGKQVLDDLTAVKTVANSVSGEMRLSYKNAPDEIQTDSVSGSCFLKLPEGTGFSSKLDSVSGSFHSSIPVTVTDKRYEAGDKKVKVKANSVSGNLNISY